MPICKKCNKKFPNKMRIDNKIRTLNKRKFCLECSPFKMHNTSDLTIIKINIGQRRRPLRTCKRCKRKRGIVSKGLCGTCYTTYRRKANITKLKQLMGGRCSKCGYNKCFNALQFHHRDPDKKEFSFNSGYSYTWKKLLEEAKKCDLLCANCHAEVHSILFPSVI